MLAPARNHPTYWAFLAHRLSGVLLALFLPAHFYVLALAIEGAAALDGFLAWSQRPSVKAAETLLIVALAVHLGGGLRLLALEFLPWRDSQKTLAAAAFGLGLLAGLAFLLNAT